MAKTWTRHDVNNNFNGPASVYAADIDGDGDLDILGAANVDNDITWWENTVGDGSAWTRHDIDNNFNMPRSVYAADIDRDGDLDVLGASQSGNDITWWENVAIVGDLDSDGDVDFVDFADFANHWLESVE